MDTQNQKHIQAVLDLATAGDVAQGISWYATALTAAQELAARYNIYIATACAVIAALSPRNKWERNLIDAENLINVYTTVGIDACKDVKVCTFGKNKAKALVIVSRLRKYHQLVRSYVSKLRTITLPWLMQMTSQVMKYKPSLG